MTVKPKQGTCVFCMNDDVELTTYNDEEMCYECQEHFYTEHQQHLSDLEDSLKYEQESDDWLPEDEEDE